MESSRFFLAKIWPFYEKFFRPEITVTTSLHKNYKKFKVINDPVTVQKPFELLELSNIGLSNIRTLILFNQRTDQS